MQIAGMVAPSEGMKPANFKTLPFGGGKIKIKFLPLVCLKTDSWSCPYVRNNGDYNNNADFRAF